MKKYFVLVLLLTMAVSLCACGQKEMDKQTKEPGVSAQTTQTDSLDKQKGAVTIEITPPDGWTKVQGSVLPVQYMKETASFMAKEEPFNNANIDDVVTEALEMYRKSFDNLTVKGEIEPITVDGKDARKLTFTCTVSKMNMKYMYVYLFAADKTYVITFGDLETTFDNLADDYETILKDIRFKAQ